MMISSYVDYTTVVLAANARTLACDAGFNLFNELSAVATSWGLRFSGLKTEWIGIGDMAWDPLELGGVLLAPVDDMRVLGYRINRHLNWSSHANHWLERGPGVRNRISTVCRRFGDRAGAGAWEAYRLFQGVYLPTVYYGLEFIGDYPDYMKWIQIHVNDTLCPIF